MLEPKRPLKVFLCHASADKPKVRELYRTLRRRGLQPWLDTEDLIPGQTWEVEIPKAILSSDAILICLSPNSVDKEGYVQKEIKFALDKALEMPEGRIFLIPARLEECELPFSLSKYQAVNLFEKDGYTKLMKALKLRASQLHLAEVALPKAGEITGEIEKIVEEKKPPEPTKEEKPEAKTPKSSTQKVDVGGDVSDSVIVTGSNNVINVGKQETPSPKPKKERVAESPKPIAKNEQPKKTNPPRKPNTAIIVALIGLAGTIVAALLSSPFAENWFSPAPVATEIESATATANLISQPITVSKTVEPSQTPIEKVTLTVSVTSSPSPTSTSVLRVDNIADISVVREFGKHANSIAFSPDGKYLVAGSWVDNIVRIWDVDSGELVHEFTGHSKPVRKVVFSPLGDLVASGSEDKTLKVWEIASQKEILSLTDENTGVPTTIFNMIDKLGFSPDGKLLAWSYAAFTNYTVLSRVPDGTLIRKFDGTFLAFSPDGTKILTTLGNKSAQLLVVSDGTYIFSLDGHTDWVRNAIFSSDGKLIATAGGDNRIRLWDANSGQLLNTLVGHTGYVEEIALSPDGKLIMSTGHDNSLRFWDIDGNLLRTEFGYGLGIAFAPDGNTIITCVGKIKVWAFP